VFVVVGWAGDIRVGSGSDAGGKAATARVMAADLTCDPDIGWWASDHDPDATLHQLLNTEVRGDQFVQATSVSYQCLVMPFQRALGPWGPVVVSMAGAVAAALAAAAIARALGGDTRGQSLAFWLVGLVGPAGFYALDAWEHAPALGLVGWAVALALGRPSIGRAVAIGVLGGVAVTFRAESAPYLAAFVLAALTVGEVRRRWLARPLAVGAGAAAAGAVIGAYLLVERMLVEASVRGSRGGDLAGQAAGQLGERFETGVITTLGVFSTDDHQLLLLGAVLCAGAVAYGRRAAAAPNETPDVVQVGLGVGLGARLVAGLGFVPGALPAAPMAAVGVWSGRRSPDHRWLVRTALLGPPLVLALQWSGNLVAQWGGRYLLTSGLLLTAAGCSVVAGEARGRRVPAGLVPAVAVCVLIGAFGAAWRIDRTTTIGGVIDQVQDVPADTVIVTTEAHLARDAGATYGDRRWLVVGSPEEAELAAEVIAAEAPVTVVLVQRSAVVPLDEVVERYDMVSEGTLDLFGNPLVVSRYEIERTFP
jgi:hypothetical protein